MTEDVTRKTYIRTAICFLPADTLHSLYCARSVGMTKQIDYQRKARCCDKISDGFRGGGDCALNFYVVKYFGKGENVMQKKKKKKVIIAISAILAFLILAVCIAVPCIYENGLLTSVHPLKKPKDGQIRVACVGDSLTYGHGISGWSKNNYPTQLGNMLGDGYCVNNYGYSGRTASFSGDRPYTDEKLYRQSLDFAPEIVVIMLGSNDTKPENWRGKDEYIKDYKEIINSYLQLDSVKQVFIMSPPPVWARKGEAPYDISTELVSGDVYFAAQEIAEELDIEYIDLHTLFADKEYMFKDGAHPNADGAKLIAQAVYGEIVGD